MDTIDRLVILFSLSALVVCLIMEHNAPAVVGDTKGSIPADRLNVSTDNDTMLPGPSYLLSNLPVVRRGDDVLQIVSEEFAPC